MTTPQQATSNQQYHFLSPGPPRPHAGAFKQAVHNVKDVLNGFDATVFSTLLHNASPEALNHVVEQHGARFVTHTASRIAGHLQTKDLDAMMWILLPKLSATFIDKVFELRLESIKAQPLVNALARAERLGFDVRDIVTTNQAAHGGRRQEAVIPTANPVPAPATKMSLGPAVEPHRHAVPSKAEIIRLRITFCSKCNRPCGGPTALTSHHNNGHCGQPPPPSTSFGKENCVFCGQRFAGVQGLRYHLVNQVCGKYSDEVESALLGLFADADRLLGKKRVSESQQQGGGGKAPPASSGTGDSKDPVSLLTPEKRQQYETEMARVEELFGRQMKAALELPGPEQKAEILRLKNCFNNKQSTTRKKFGVLLRERRTKQEIEEERVRMLGGGDKRQTPTPTPSTGKRPREREREAQVDGGTPGPPTSVSVPSSRNGSADVSVVGVGASRQDIPSSKRVMLSYRSSGIGGGGSSPRSADVGSEKNGEGGKKADDAIEIDDSGSGNESGSESDGENTAMKVD